MLEEERMCEAAVHALSQLAIKDMALSNESFMAREVGDHARAEAADTARTALVPSFLKAEEDVLRAKIAGARAAKENIAQLIRRDAGKVSTLKIEEIVDMFTLTFDDDVSQAEQQLANNLEEQARIESGS